MKPMTRNGIAIAVALMLAAGEVLFARPPGSAATARDLEVLQIQHHPKYHGSVRI